MEPAPPHSIYASYLSTASSHFCTEFHDQVQDKLQQVMALEKTNDVVGHERELLVVSWLRQFRRVTADDLALLVVVQNFLGSTLDCVESLPEDEFLEALDESFVQSLDIEIEAMFADMELSQENPLMFTNVALPLQSSSSGSKRIASSNFSADWSFSYDSDDPFVRWDDRSPTPDGLLCCNEEYSARNGPVSGQVLQLQSSQAPASLTPSTSPVTNTSSSTCRRRRDLLDTKEEEESVRVGCIINYKDDNIPTPPKQTIASKSRSVSDIVYHRFSIAELVEYDLLERLLHDQYGSKYLQSQLNQQLLENKTECVELVLQHLIRVKKVDLTAICEDMYANYSIQLLFICGDQRQRTEMVQYFVLDYIIRLSRSKFGCRVIQKMLEVCDDQATVLEIAAAFRKQCEQRPGILSQCIQCCNVNRVLQVLIQLKLPFAEMKFLADELNRDLVRYSEHRNACRVLQSFVGVYGDKIDIKQLLSNRTHLHLATTVHGNYVITCFMQTNEWYSNQEAFVAFRKKFIFDIFDRRNVEYFSKHKQGSHVMEECIRSSTPKQRWCLAGVLCADQGLLLQKLMRDKFGNYVPTTLLKYANRKQQLCIVNTIHAHIANLNCCDRHRATFRHCWKFIGLCGKIKNRGHAYYAVKKHEEEQKEEKL